MCVAFAFAKATHIFFSKNTCKLDIVITRTVNILTTNKLIKLTTLWTTGPRAASVDRFGYSCIKTLLLFACFCKPENWNKLVNLGFRPSENGLRPKTPYSTYLLHCALRFFKITGKICSKICNKGTLKKINEGRFFFSSDFLNKSMLLVLIWIASTCVPREHIPF